MQKEEDAMRWQQTDVCALRKAGYEAPPCVEDFELTWLWQVWSVDTTRIGSRACSRDTLHSYKTE
jgi:hypothetical protein